MLKGFVPMNMLAVVEEADLAAFSVPDTIL